MNVRVLLFDYGGVLAEEGFREGLFSIARQQGLEPDAFYKVAQEGVYDTGFVSGRGTEADFWRYMRDRFSLQGDDTSLSSEILQPTETEGNVPHFLLFPNREDPSRLTIAVIKYFSL